MSRFRSRTSLALLVALVALGPASGLLAQQDPAVCYPDCQNSHWDPVQSTHIVTLPGGCQVVVKYTTRYACNRWWDVFFYGLELLDPTDPACQGLKSMAVADVLDLVTEQFLKDNPMGFPPNQPGECDTNWRVVKGSCWSKGEISPFPSHPLTPFLWLPCTETACCLKPYTVCLDDCGNPTVEEGAWGSYGGCPGAGSLTLESCEPVCN